MRSATSLPGPASSAGFTLIEVLVSMTLVAIISAVAMPLLAGTLGRWRAASAASYLSGRLHRARLDAVRRSATVAVQFLRTADGYSFRTFVDGNRNGVLSTDITRGIDVPITSPETLGTHFPGVIFGIRAGVTGIDPGIFDSEDPVQIGSSTLLSFSPDGSCTAGTLFVLGERGDQFAVRVLGTTGRTRILEYRFAEGTWQNR